jgi:CheY-like chemotaxis protein
MKRLENILLVEDNHDDVELIRYAFRKAEIASPFHVVSDGEQAIGYLKGDPPFEDRDSHPLPSLILLDLKLPRRSGFEVLEFAKQNPRTRLIPIVVLTSSNQTDDIRRAYELCANSYLVKPVSRDALVAMMRSLDHYWLGLNEIAR